MMDKNNRSTLGKKDGGGGVGLVPFQGIGTRLRRSRSKDHSTDQDNLSNDFEISNLKRLQYPHHQQQFMLGHNNGYDGLNIYSSSGGGGGTLERTTKRFYGTNNTSPIISMFDNQQHHPHNSSFIQQQQLLDQRLMMKNGSSSSALYEESRLLSHQYEEPQYLIDVNYRTRQQQQQQQQRDLYGKF
ncbi:hypothetical protein BLA29_011501, partial [Euroglyphus maynei]